MFQRAKRLICSLYFSQLPRKGIILALDENVKTLQVPEMVPRIVSFQKLNHPNFLSMQKPNVGPINPTFPVLMSYNLSSQISQIKNLPNQRGSRGG